VWEAQGIGDHTHEKVLPNGVVELIVNLGAPQRVVDPDDPSRFTRYASSWVAGAQRSFIVIASEVDCDLVGIRFRPGGAYALLGAPMSALTDAVVEGEALGRPLRGRLAELQARLAAASPGCSRVHVVEDMLLRAVAPERLDPRVAAAVRVAGLADEGVPVAAIAAELGVSHKHLIALFKRHVGLTPKMLARVLRLQALLRGIAGARAVDWAAAAARFGYFDQAHLIAEFRALAGTTPTGYLAERLADTNHVRV
jgi:methylphosphotriester-DNA--protein-cysteine methyltransferase